MEDYILKRTGREPVKFTGELLADIGGPTFKGREQNRWHDLALYKTQAGQYILYITYHTTWEGESDHYVVIVTSAGELAYDLSAYDPLEHVVGFPPHPQFADKQARLQAQIKRIYETRVTELLSAHNEIAEEIE